MASVKPELGWIVYARSDFPHPGWFLFFQRRPGPYCAKLIQTRSGWPGQVWGKRIWSGSKLECKNHWAQFLAECHQPATGFPLSDSGVFFHRCPGLYCAKPTLIRLGSGRLRQVWADHWVLADYVRFGPYGSGLEASWCVRNGLLLHRSGSDANRI